MKRQQVSWKLTIEYPRIVLVEGCGRPPHVHRQELKMSVWNMLVDELQEQTVVICDLRRLIWFSSELLGHLIWTARELEKRNSRVILCELSEGAKETLEITKIYRHWKMLFNYCESRENALQKALEILSSQDRTDRS